MITISLILGAIGLSLGVNELADSEMIRVVNTLLNLFTIIYIARLQGKAKSEIAAPVQQLQRELLEPRTDGRRSYDPNHDSTTCKE